MRELKRQKSSSLFLRLAASKDKAGVLKLAELGKLVERPEDILRDPYVFEFLKIPEPYQISEKDLETRLIDNLQSFLLELGKGFTFVGRQYGITIDNERYKVDLVFYLGDSPLFTAMVGSTKFSTAFTPVFFKLIYPYFGILRIIFPLFTAPPRNKSIDWNRTIG